MNNQRTNTQRINKHGSKRDVRIIESSGTSSHIKGSSKPKKKKKSVRKDVLPSLNEVKEEGPVKQMRRFSAFPYADRGLSSDDQALDTVAEEDIVSNEADTRKSQEGDSLNDNCLPEVDPDELAKFKETYLASQYDSVPIHVFMQMIRSVEDKDTLTRLYLSSLESKRQEEEALAAKSKLLSDMWESIKNLECTLYSSSNKLKKLMSSIKSIDNPNIKASWEQLLIKAVDVSPKYYNSKFVMAVINEGLNTNNQVFIPKLAQMLDILSYDEYKVVMGKCLIPAMDRWCLAARKLVVKKGVTFGRASASSAMIWIDSRPRMSTARKVAQENVQYYLVLDRK